MQSLEISVKVYKRELDRELRHIKLILAHERHSMPAAEWRQLVQQTKESILKAPQDFLCKDLPSRTLFFKSLEKVFEGFIEDQRLLSIQSQKTFVKPPDAANSNSQNRKVKRN